MKRFALIEGNTVANIVEQNDAPTIEGQWIEVTGLQVGPGFAVNDGTFVLPVASSPRHITQLAFLSRFTDAEAVAIDLASIGSTAQAAMVRRYLSKVGAAKFIDLDREDTRVGVRALEAAGLLAAGRALQILDGLIEERERA